MLVIYISCGTLKEELSINQELFKLEIVSFNVLLRGDNVWRSKMHWRVTTKLVTSEARHTLTSVSKLSLLSSTLFLWFLQGEFIQQSTFLRLVIISFILVILTEETRVLL